MVSPICELIQKSTRQTLEELRLYDYHAFFMAEA